MANAQGSKTQLSYIKEVTYGEVPVGAAKIFQILPIETHSLTLTKEVSDTSEIHSDRNHRFQRHRNRSAEGDIKTKFFADVYDEFLESALMGTWDTTPSGPDVLKNASDFISFSFEDYATDIDRSVIYEGMAVNTLSLNVAPQQEVEATFGFNGRRQSNSADERNTSAVTTNEPMDSYSGTVTSADFGGTLASLDIVTGIELNISNGLQNSFVVGQDSAPSQSCGMFDLTGTLSVYYDGATWLDKFADEVYSQLYFTLNDPSGANEYTFFLPKIKTNGAPPVLESPNDRILSIPFKALYDPTEAATLIITRPETV